MPEIEYLIEKNPIKFYDPIVKEKIREEVWPILQSAFVPGSAEPWKIDDKSSLLLIWSELEEFFINLVWCSKLKIPFVFDLEHLRRVMIVIRDRLVKEGKLSNPRILNDLIAIISLYDMHNIECFMPCISGRGTAMEIWQHLRTDVSFLQVSQATNKLGFMRNHKISRQLLRIKKMVKSGATNSAIAGSVTIGKAGVSVLLGPAGKIGSEIVNKFISAIIKSPYVPPVYSISDIEQSFNRLYYPEEKEKGINIFSGDETKKRKRQTI